MRPESDNSGPFTSNENIETFLITEPVVYRVSFPCVFIQRTETEILLFVNFIVNLFCRQWSFSESTLFFLFLGAYRKLEVLFLKGKNPVWLSTVP